MKKTIKLIFVIIVILLIIYMIHMADEYINPTYKQIFVGERKWNVISSYPNCNDAALLLSHANSKILKFLTHIKKKYYIDMTDEEIKSEGRTYIDALILPNDIRNMAGVLITNYNPDEFYETDPRYTNDTSYTIDKGQSTYLCLRDKKNPEKLIDLDTVIFVILHESAHMANYKYWGHDTYFWIVFKWILHDAAESGAYNPINYAIHPIDFCGLHVAYNPLYDTTLPNIWNKI